MLYFAEQVCNHTPRRLYILACGVQRTVVCQAPLRTALEAIMQITNSGVLRNHRLEMTSCIGARENNLRQQRQECIYVKDKGEKRKTQTAKANLEMYIPPFNKLMELSEP